MFSLLFILLIFLLFSLKTLMRVVDAQQQREPASRESIEKFFEAFDEGEEEVTTTTDDGDAGGEGDGGKGGGGGFQSFQSLENLVKLAQKVADESSEYYYDEKEMTSRASDGKSGSFVDVSDDDLDEFDFSDDFESERGRGRGGEERFGEEEEKKLLWESISQSGVITNECGYGESKENSLCFKIDEASGRSDGVSRQVTTVPVNVIGGALVRFEIAIDTLFSNDGDEYGGEKK